MGPYWNNDNCLCLVLLHNHKHFKFEVSLNILTVLSFDRKVHTKGTVVQELVHSLSFTS